MSAGNVTYESTELRTSEDNLKCDISSKKIWKDINTEKQEQIAKVNDYLASKNHSDTPENPELKYLNENIFPLLLPILEKTVFKAIQMECLTNQKSLFNGIDFISERVWLSNTIHPERLETNQNIFLMPWVNEWLKDHPRPIFPKSWIWTKEEAALFIQSYMRGHFVRRLEEVQEVRQFWKTIKRERKEREQKEQEIKEQEIQEQQRKEQEAKERESKEQERKKRKTASSENIEDNENTVKL